MDDKLNEIKMLREALKETWFEHWLNVNVFTLEWCIIVISIVLPLFIFWKLVDKKRLREIIFVGITVALIGFSLDQIGSSLLLWTYPYTLTPLMVEAFDPANFSILPVIYMLIYQWFAKWKSYVYAHIIFAFFAAFVGENIYEWLGLYELTNWQHIFSVPFYFLIGLFIKWFVNKIMEIETIYSKST
ncbi:CBO0543 family protein [Anaerobacillus sp. MEB173]|uniref:CBO0543 family protein n=1 Tax=Anaerobacillus sp. MEB173 TaxID=3383345 RepID=UPI003F8F751C